MITASDLRLSYKQKSAEIKERLSEFEKIISGSDDKRIFEELVFCILTAGTSAKLCIEVIEQVRDVIQSGSKAEITAGLKKCYRFYNIRAEYIHITRKYLRTEFDMKLREMLLSFDDPIERRDFIALNKNIKGIGFKESSHFLRNIGFKGYAILDKHIIRYLFELGVIKEPKTPTNRKNYLDTESRYIEFALKNGFDVDELDLLLWSEKTGTILK